MCGRKTPPLFRLAGYSMWIKNKDMLAKKLGLSELTITTAGDHHFIMGLAEEDAVQLRRQIIELSKLDDKDAYYD